MKIVIASDHGGFSLKQEILTCLSKGLASPPPTGKASLEPPPQRSFSLAGNFTITDLGSFTADSVDYPDTALLVAKEVSSGNADRGILICGTGIGMAITANKFKGVRAASITDLYSARMSREHNDLNVLCLGGRVLGPALAEEIILTFLKTPFAGGRHQSRVKKIHQYE